jgi:hypothetical protein
MSAQFKQIKVDGKNVSIVIDGLKCNKDCPCLDEFDKTKGICVAFGRILHDNKRCDNCISEVK